MAEDYSDTTLDLEVMRTPWGNRFSFFDGEWNNVCNLLVVPLVPVPMQFVVKRGEDTVYEGRIEGAGSDPRFVYNGMRVARLNASSFENGMTISFIAAPPPGQRPHPKFERHMLLSMFPDARRDLFHQPYEPE